MSKTPLHYGSINRSVSNLLKLANFIWEKVKMRKETKHRKKINKIEHSKTILWDRQEIAALDRFDFHLVTGEKVSSHSDIIHSSFQRKTILFHLWLFTIFHSIFRFFLVFTFSRFFDELLAWRLQWNYFIKIFETDLLSVK